MEYPTLLHTIFYLMKLFFTISNFYLKNILFLVARDFVTDMIKEQKAFYMCKAEKLPKLVFIVTVLFKNSESTMTTFKISLYDTSTTFKIKKFLLFILLYVQKVGYFKLYYSCILWVLFSFLFSEYCKMFTYQDSFSKTSQSDYFFPFFLVSP